MKLLTVRTVSCGVPLLSRDSGFALFLLTLESFLLTSSFWEDFTVHWADISSKRGGVSDPLEKKQEEGRTVSALVLGGCHSFRNIRV